MEHEGAERPEQGAPALPRRSAQAHLEPQLREERGAGTGTPFAAFTPTEHGDDDPSDVREHVDEADQGTAGQAATGHTGAVSHEGAHRASPSGARPDDAGSSCARSDDASPSGAGPISAGPGRPGPTRPRRRGRHAAEPDD